MLPLLEVLAISIVGQVDKMSKGSYGDANPRYSFYFFRKRQRNSTLRQRDEFLQKRGSTSDSNEI